jgi:hypothetical protein
MSDECYGGYWESHLVRAPQASFCCSCVQNFKLAPGFVYKHNTPLRKIQGTLGVFEPWQPGQKLEAVARCEVDLTSATEPCPASVCTGNADCTLADPKSIAWPMGTTYNHIEQVRCDKDSCIKLAQMGGC